MSFKDVSDMALAGEYFGRILDEYLDVLIEKNNLKKPTEEELKKMTEKVMKELQEKYPHAGIKGPEK